MRPCSASEPSIAWGGWGSSFPFSRRSSLPRADGCRNESTRSGSGGPIHSGPCWKPGYGWRGGLTPSESLTGAQALGLFTDGVAAGGGRPLPTLVGQPANFTVLGADPTDHPAPHRIEMLATVIDGVVFRGEPE